MKLLKAKRDLMIIIIVGIGYFIPFLRVKFFKTKEYIVLSAAELILKGGGMFVILPFLFMLVYMVLKGTMNLTVSRQLLILRVWLVSLFAYAIKLIFMLFMTSWVLFPGFYILCGGFLLFFFNEYYVLKGRKVILMALLHIVIPVLIWVVLDRYLFKSGYLF